MGCRSAEKSGGDLSPSFFPSLPLEVGPLNPARGLGIAVSSPSRVWDGAPAETEFGEF